MRDAPFFAAVAQDPVLARALLIAEPWDIGPGGYRLGGFPPGWLEWNDRFRDTQRGFWLHRGATAAASSRIGCAASSDEFGHDGRAPTASVNFITAHDGFTLRDLVSYTSATTSPTAKATATATAHNLSRNFGVEGDTDDAAVLHGARPAQRALLATLLLSQGTPMLLAGDELGHSQGGNNNAYCQDNETSWIDWAQADHALIDFVARLAALRRAAAPLRRAHWWPAALAADGAGLHWYTPAGRAMTPADWEHRGNPGAGQDSAAVAGGDEPQRHALAALYEEPGSAGEAWLLLANAERHPVVFTLPAGRWQELLDSGAPQHGPGAGGTEPAARMTVSAGSLRLLRRDGPAVLR